MASKVLIADEEEYIDMEITSFSLISPPNPMQEFEFQISSSPSSSSSSTFIFQHMEASSSYSNSSSSPADYLFYKGKLLPLHHLQNPNNNSHLCYNIEKDYAFQDYFYSTNEASSPSDSSSSSSSEFESKQEFLYGTIPLTSTTPFESCNGSRKLSLDECDFDEFDCSTNYKKLKTRSSLKNSSSSSSSLGSKLRAWIGKVSCKYEAYVTKIADDEGSSLSKALSNNNSNKNKHVKNTTFGQIHRTKFQSSNYVQEKASKLKGDNTNTDTRHDSTPKYRCFIASNGNVSKRISRQRSSLCGSSSSSFSVHPNKPYYGCQELDELHKGINSEIGNSILAAIAHCKQSQQYSSFSED